MRVFFRIYVFIDFYHIFGTKYINIQPYFLSHSSCNLFYRDHILFYYVSNLFIRQVTCKINDCKTLQCSFNSIQILRFLYIKYLILKMKKSFNHITNVNKKNSTSEKDLCILSRQICGAFLQLEKQEHI